MDTLIVAGPYRNVDELREFRDYVMESLGCGVLVLPDTCTYTCMQSTCWTDTGDYIVRPACRTETDKPDAEPEPEPPEPKFNGKGAAEKRAAFERLKRYWKHKGLGSLDDVAALAGGVTAAYLRGALVDRMPLTLETWRRIASALDALEAPDEP